MRGTYGHCIAIYLGQTPFKIFSHEFHEFTQIHKQLKLNHTNFLVFLVNPCGLSVQKFVRFVKFVAAFFSFFKVFALVFYSIAFTLLTKKAIKIPNIPMKANENCKPNSSEIWPITGGPIKNPKKLTLETAVKASPVGIVGCFPAIL